MADTPSVREARARYFAENDFGEDGGYGARWVKLDFGGLPVAFPNTASRVRAVKVHDVHHVVTGYATTPTGEAEIGAWEVAGGCGRHLAAWALNLWAFAYGVVLAPGPVFRAFVRGRRSRTLYGAPELDESLLDQPVAAVRTALRIPEATPAASLGDGLAFILWALAAWVWTLGGLVLLLLPLWLGVRALC